jgi:putative nucleotidyltransferase with HDIG domain
LSRESVIEYAKSMANLPPLNALTGKLSSLLRDEEVSFSRLSDLISYDPVLSFRLISAANSPWYNRGNPVTNIGLSITLLGLDEVRNLVMCAVFYDGLLKKSGLRKKDAVQFWIHSLLAAFATKRLAAHSVECLESDTRRDEFFTAGLLHDIGKVPFLINPELRSANIASLHRSAEKERKKYGIDHCEVGFFLAREWKLPEDYQNAIRFHHEERRTGLPARTLADYVGDADNLVTSDTVDEDISALRAAAEKDAQGVVAIFSA